MDSDNWRDWPLMNYGEKEKDRDYYEWLKDRMEMVEAAYKEGIDRKFEETPYIAGRRINGTINWGGMVGASSIENRPYLVQPIPKPLSSLPRHWAAWEKAEGRRKVLLAEYNVRDKGWNAWHTTHGTDTEPPPGWYDQFRLKPLPPDSRSNRLVPEPIPEPKGVGGLGPSSSNKGWGDIGPPVGLAPSGLQPIGSARPPEINKGWGNIAEQRLQRKNWGNI